MPEHSGYSLGRVGGRSIVRLRVRPGRAAEAAAALRLPREAATWRNGDPTTHWLGPDVWLLCSDTKPAEEIIGDIDAALSGLLHAATDQSSGNACLTLAGPAARTLLAMGCGIDVHPDAFRAGQCVRTRFAQVHVLIVALEDERFDLYVDRSLEPYLADWLAAAGEDPLAADPRVS